MFFNLSYVVYTILITGYQIGYKVYGYDVQQTEMMKEYVKEIVGSSERVVESKIENLRVSMGSGMKAMRSELLSEIRAMKRWW